MFESRLLKENVPVAPTPPNTFGGRLCPDVAVSEGLFGVEKPPNTFESAALFFGWLFCCAAGAEPKSPPEALLFCAWPNLNPPVVLLPSPPNRLLPPPPPPLKMELPPAMLVLPNGLVADVVGVSLLDPNRPPPDCGVLVGV